MAISKEQPMRPALNDCVDFLNNNLDDLDDLDNKLTEIEDKLTEIEGYTLIACDDTTYNVLSQGAIQGVTVIRQTPIEMFNSGTWEKNNVRLCWFVNMQIEIAQPQFVATPNNSGVTIMCMAKGIASTVYGLLGTDAEWSTE